MSLRDLKVGKVSGCASPAMAEDEIEQELGGPPLSGKALDLLRLSNEHYQELLSRVGLEPWQRAETIGEQIEFDALFIFDARANAMDPRAHSEESVGFLTEEQARAKRMLAFMERHRASVPAAGAN